MLKILFACLLLVNAVLLGAQFGWLDALLSGSHEPQRLKNQINPDKLKLTPPDAGQPASSSSMPAVGTEATLAAASASTSASAFAPAPAAASSAASPAATAPASSLAATAVTRPAAATAAVPTVPAAPAATSTTAPAAATVTAAPTSPAAMAQSPAKALACLEIGNLGATDARRMEAALTGLKLAQAPVRREIREESSHMVWIPPLPDGREGAERKVAELKRMGVSEFHVLPDSSAPAHRNGVSLGVFKTEEAAKARLAALAEKGVRSARIIEYHMPLVRVAFQLRELDAASREAVGKLRADYPRSEAKACETPPA